MRAMRINVTEFVKEYTAAAEANLSSRELADLLGMSQAGVWHRADQCRKHGIELPVLRGGRLLSPQSRARRRAKYRKNWQQNRKPEAASKSQAQAAVIDAVADRVADKVFARLRDTLRFQFFVGPEIPA
jgi:biotin operon repressor